MRDRLRDMANAMYLAMNGNVNPRSTVDELKAFGETCAELIREKVLEEGKAMNAVEAEVKALVYKELESANAHFPAFHSPHEGWAVIREEADELKEESMYVGYLLESMWEKIKKNEKTEMYAKDVLEYGVNAACEAIQVAAMARKYLDMLERMDE